LPPRKESLVEYADGEDASAFAMMLGGLIEANIAERPDKRGDFDSLKARVGIQVEDIDESVTLDFRGGTLKVSNGLKRDRKITIRTDADTVMMLSNLAIGPFGMPVYIDSVGRGIVAKLLTGGLKIDGMLTNIPTLNQVTRVFSVR
jgi:SCP-2 sterol transfer family protein